MAISKPIIGITLDREEKDYYAPLPWYALRENYAEHVTALGGVPLMLPYDESAIDTYLALIDGLIITGGNFDIDPSYYNDTSTHQETAPKHKRTSFEFHLVKQALNLKLPLLGICGGEQLLNVVLGGTLHQHVPEAFPNGLPHEVKDRLHPAHDVEVLSNTLLYRITKATRFGVNTSHHQAVKEVGKGLIVSALAPDGVIEAIELPSHPFLLGVQWHPEYRVSPADDAIMSAFLTSANTYRSQKENHVATFSHSTAG